LNSLAKSTPAQIFASLNSSKRVTHNCSLNPLLRAYGKNGTYTDKAMGGARNPSPDVAV